jgi:hypothetical protein
MMTIGDSDTDTTRRAQGLGSSFQCKLGAALEFKRRPVGVVGGFSLYAYQMAHGGVGHGQPGLWEGGGRLQDLMIATKELSLQENIASKNLDSSLYKQVLARYKWACVEINTTAFYLAINYNGTKEIYVR